MANIVVYYDTMTGNVQRFAEKISRYSDFKLIKLNEDLIIESNSHLITFTTGFGNIPKKTEKFLENNENYKKIKTVTVSGNMNWGPNYGLAGNKISQKYNIDLLFKFELSGNLDDVKLYIKLIKKIEKDGN